MPTPPVVTVALPLSLVVSKLMQAKKAGLKAKRKYSKKRSFGDHMSEVRRHHRRRPRALRSHVHRIPLLTLSTAPRCGGWLVQEGDTSSISTIVLIYYAALTVYGAVIVYVAGARVWEVRRLGSVGDLIARVHEKDGMGEVGIHT